MQYSALISKPKSDNVFLRLPNIISYVLPCLSEQNMNINWHQFPFEAFDIDPTPRPIAMDMDGPLGLIRYHIMASPYHGNISYMIY